MTSENIQYVEDAASFENALKNNKLFVSYFTASWCGPCQAIKPIIEQLYTRYENVEVLKVDLNENADLASKYNVSSIPTLNFYHKAKLVDSVTGADVNKIKASFERLSALDPSAKRVGPIHQSKEMINDLCVVQEIKSFIPSKEFDCLNSFIDFNGFEAMNLLPMNPNLKSVQSVFKLHDDKNKEITDSLAYTDADSQCICYVPFTNTVKLYSVLIKLRDPETVKLGDEFKDQREIDETDDLQSATEIRVWKNKTSAISFDDATSDTHVDHAEMIAPEKINENGWYEVKFKYVKFQKVNSVNLFFEGEDEDAHTLIERIIFIGISGQSRATKTIQPDEE